MGLGSAPFSRIELRPREAAAVLAVTERDVVNMLRRGALRNVAAQRCRRVDPAQLATIVAERRERLDILAGLLDGSLTVRVGRAAEVPTVHATPARASSSRTSADLSYETRTDRE
jgi:hypothetical protein